jgi:hypothetical protein
VFVVALSAGFSGCAALRSLGAIPHAEFSVNFVSRPTPATVLGCVKSAIQALSPPTQTRIAESASVSWRQGHWSTDVTAWNVDEGLMETGNYPESNLQGLRIRAVYTRETSILHLQIKAAGPYGSDLGAQASGRELLKLVEKCVEG